MIDVNLYISYPLYELERLCMQKYVLVLGLVLSFVGCTYAEQSATACFDLGFNAAAKAFNAGDKSAFTPVYGMSPAMMKKSPCCTNGMNKQCMAYNTAFQSVMQNGPSKYSEDYADKKFLFQQIDAGMLGF